MTLLPATIPTLETDRLILRAPGADDEAAILDFLRSDRAEFYGGPMDLGTAWGKLASYAGQWMLRGYGMFAVVEKASGHTVGMAGPYHPAHFPEPEMSWLVTSAQHEGKGLAREACQAVLHHLFADLNWPYVVSYIDRDNTRSRALADRLGAQVAPDLPAPINNCDTYRHLPSEGGQ